MTNYELKTLHPMQGDICMRYVLLEHLEKTRCKCKPNVRRSLQNNEYSITVISFPACLYCKDKHTLTALVHAKNLSF